ncbi:type I-E CRISPR-associated protein Cse2/CasB [Candidatus Harpocratesius sp.]
MENLKNFQSTSPNSDNSDAEKMEKTEKTDEINGKISKERNHQKTEIFHHFLTALQELEKTDRGQYAALKRASGTVLGDSIPAMAAFYKILPFSEQNSRLEPIYYLIATLFPLQPQAGMGNFGDTMAQTKKEFGDSGSIDLRFQNLLDCSLDSSSFDPVFGNLDSFREFSYRLRQCVNLAASKQVGISWYNLLTDLYFWSRDYSNNRSVQKSWARAYYGASQSSVSSSSSSSSK